MGRQLSLSEIELVSGGEDEVVSNGTRLDTYEGGGTFMGTGGHTGMGDYDGENSSNEYDEVIVTAEIQLDQSNLSIPASFQDKIIVLRGTDGEDRYFFDGRSYGTDEGKWMEDIYDSLVEELLSELDGSGVDHLNNFLGTSELTQAFFDALPTYIQRFILEWYYGIDLS